MDKNRTAKVGGPAKASGGVDSAGGPLSGQGADGGLTDVSGLDFEQAMAELERVTGSLENGDLPIAEALSAYQRGAALMRHAQSILNHVQTEIEVVESDQQQRVDRSALVAQVKD